MPSKRNVSEMYSRQILLPEIGVEGQLQLHQKKVAIVGIGAVGSVTAELLTRAGVENVIIIDRDCIEESNLQRQTLFTEGDIGKSKVNIAQEKLQKINSHSKIRAEAINLSAKNIDLLQGIDLVLDCTDNVETRFLLNDFCRKEKIPWIYAAAIRTSGYVMPILPSGPCLSCFLTPASLETCDRVGVLNTITTSIAALQVTIAFKIILGKEVEPILTYYNIWDTMSKSITVKKKQNCQTCQGNYIYLHESGWKFPIRFCSSGIFQIQGQSQDLKNIKEQWQKIGAVVDDGETLRFRNLTLFKDGRALIKADSEKEAIVAYSKYIGT
ncbi:MAG: HesA/MoeB/ThiF family protein [Nanoarchaeota archaeon]|nr:HesA/MoeB/ThiF family protein [Nanoarchaeota archaeon]